MFNVIEVNIRQLMGRTCLTFTMFAEKKAGYVLAGYVFLVMLPPSYPA